MEIDVFNIGFGATVALRNVLVIDDVGIMATGVYYSVIELYDLLRQHSMEIRLREMEKAGYYKIPYTLPEYP